jgi:hypothetical protein
MSWCLEVEPRDQHSCRLISRWHTGWFVTSAGAPWTVLSDPSSFVTERRMLLGIKARAEQTASRGLIHRHLPDGGDGVGPGCYTPALGQVTW